MRLVTSNEKPPIPLRQFDWVAFDEEQMSGICADPDCNCRVGLVRGWGATEEEAIRDFVSNLLMRCDVDVDAIASSRSAEKENAHAS